MHSRMRLDRNVPTWRYLYRGNFTSLSPTTWLGAYHTGNEMRLISAQDTHCVLGLITYPKLQLHLRERLTPADTSKRFVKSYEYFLGAWVAFAKNPQNGLSKYGWPQFSFDCQTLQFCEPTLINLALDNTTQVVFTSANIPVG
ncbi:hypothetical protein N7499_010195 [Penicillium canescens]|nr:hypothetical protein N7499_010195 [Penicillium canescens]KAJ6170860.1 hypothetical protein N7485_008206 [Penicillium canescens]